jgi:hypothetical protein
MHRFALLALISIATPAAAATAPRPRVVLPDDVDWKPLSSKQVVGGPVIHVLTGDPRRGPAVFLLKLPGEGEIPPHTTAAAYHAVVVSGTWMHAFGTEEAMAIPPGGYWFQPARQRRADRCPAGPDCVVLVRSSGPFVPAPAKRAGMAETLAAPPPR